MRMLNMRSFNTVILLSYQGIEIPQSKIFLLLIIVNCEVAISQVRYDGICQLSAGLLSDPAANLYQIRTVRWRPFEQDCAVHLGRVQSLGKERRNIVWT